MHVYMDEGAQTPACTYRLDMLWFACAQVTFAPVSVLAAAFLNPEWLASNIVTWEMVCKMCVCKRKQIQGVYECEGGLKLLRRWLKENVKLLPVQLKEKKISSKTIPNFSVCMVERKISIENEIGFDEGRKQILIAIPCFAAQCTQPKLESNKTPSPNPRETRKQTPNPQSQTQRKQTPNPKRKRKQNPKPKPKPNKTTSPNRSPKYKPKQTPSPNPKNTNPKTQIKQDPKPKPEEHKPQDQTQRT